MSAVGQDGATLTRLLGGGSGAALIRAEDGAQTAYGALAEAIDEIAGKLHSLGIERGGRVALVHPDAHALIPLVLGVTALGAAAAPLNPAYTRDEFAFFLEDLDPAVMIVPAGDLAAARAAAGPSIRVVEARGARLDGERHASYEPAQPDDVALLLHTSGTTSRAKQVPLRHRNLVASARSIAAFYELTDADVSYGVMPMFHIHGLVASALATWASGGSVVVPSRFLPRRFWGQLGEFQVTWFSAGPTHHTMALERRHDARAPASLRFARSCSSALSPALLDECEATYGVPVLEAYGMTEASHQMTANPLPPRARIPGSVGVPAGSDIRTVDKAGRDADVGEVVIRGPGVMSGYLNNESANVESFVGGWFRTGDRGRVSDGYLYLEGRIKELIIRGGENISPVEIEDVLASHAGVVDAVAFGIASAKYGEEVGAAVALSEPVEPKDLQAHCRERLAPFKVPVKIFVLPEIPRTATGKLQRRRIAERLLG